MASLQLCWQRRISSHRFYRRLARKPTVFPLADCTNIIVRAIKQFFADLPSIKKWSKLFSSIWTDTVLQFVLRVRPPPTISNESRDWVGRCYDASGHFPPLKSEMVLARCSRWKNSTRIAICVELTMDSRTIWKHFSQCRSSFNLITYRAEPSFSLQYPFFGLS